MMIFIKKAKFFILRPVRTPFRHLPMVVQLDLNENEIYTGKLSAYKTEYMPVNQLLAKKKAISVTGNGLSLRCIGGTYCPFQMVL